MSDNPIVNTQALTLAIRLLSAAAAGAALSTMGGCPFFGCGDTGWQETNEIDLEVMADLRALIEISDWSEDRSYTHAAAGAGGTVVAWGSDWNADGETFVDVFDVGDADLNAIAVVEDSWWVVGDGGAAAVSGDRGGSWSTVDLAGTTSDLYGITMAGALLVAVGEDVVVVRQPDGTWMQVEPPSGTWGSLRAVHYDGERLYAVGLSGVIWSTEDPNGLWVVENAGSTDDLWDVGTRFLSTEQTVVVGAGGTVLFHDESGWTRGDTNVSEDLIAHSNGRALAADGRVFDIGDDGQLTEVARFEAALDLSSLSYGGVTVVGEDGFAAEREYYECVGGRPFVVEGTLRTAPLVGGEAWCSEVTDASEVLPELREALAAGWAEDGLYEHASIASFARFALELLALGAPPSLLEDVHAAMADELHHARLCFGLARRFGARPSARARCPSTKGRWREQAIPLRPPWRCSRRVV